MKNGFTRLLLKWNSNSNNRIMPWKGERNPYKIWLSEIILQQTRVEQGLSYYQKFIDRYPTIIDLAKATDEEVFKMWEGLGYYSRCRNLLHTAREIYLNREGRFPDNYKGIIALKGVGPYTAAAISSFAYNLPYAVVDGNVQRVLSRYFGIKTPIDTIDGKEIINKLAQDLLHKNQPGIYNQAIMDFGATVCKPKTPECKSCTLHKSCVAHQQNLVNVIPVKSKKLVKKNRWFYYVVLRYKNTIYIKQRKEKDIWQGLHDFILIEKLEKQTIQTIKEEVKNTYSIDSNLLQASKLYVQQLTHQTITGCFFEAVLPTQPVLGNEYYKVSVKELSNYAFPKLLLSFLQEKKYI